MDDGKVQALVDITHVAVECVVFEYGDDSVVAHCVRSLGLGGIGVDKIIKCGENTARSGGII